MDLSRRHMNAALAALVGTGIFGIPAHAADAKLVITTLGGVWEKYWRETLVPAFVKASGADVTVDVGNGRVYTANMRVAGVEHPPYSMIMMNEVFASVLRKEGYFEKLDLTKIPSYADLYPIAKSTDGWGAVGTISPIGIGYRTDLVKTKPKSWHDLWENPEFRGKIGLYNFANSAGKMELLLASKLFGKDQHDVDAGFAALHKLGQVVQVDFNLSTLMASGEIIVAPFDFGEIARLRRQGLPVDCIVPAEGMLMFDQTFSVCKNGPAKDLAYKYIDFVLSPPTQTLLAQSFYVSPVNRNVDVPPELRQDVPVYGAQMDSILTWDWDFVNANATEFAERWNKAF